MINMKCEICKEKIEEIFLGKLVGGYVKDKGKKHAICSECQKKFKTKGEILDEI